MLMVTREIPAELAAWLAESLKEEYEPFQQSIQEDPVIGLRTNPAKSYPIPWATRPVPWHPNGYFLDVRPGFTLDPGFHAGAYYVQDPATMAIYSTLKDALQGGPKRILDLCAAPGGKSTLIASLLRSDDILLANEVAPQRYHILLENLTKWGIPNVLTLSTAPEQLQSACPAAFDVILVDAPCSGEGMFRKEPVALGQWSTGLVRQCALRQEKILDSAWELLAPGGLLIYSTCTFNHFENMDQMDRILGRVTNATPVHIQEHVSGISRIDSDAAIGYQCWPHRVSGEGFFFAALKKSENPHHSSRKKSRPLPKIHPSMAKELAHHITNYQSQSALVHNHFLYAVPAIQLDFISMLLQHFPKTEPVACLGQWIGNQIKPHPALALSTSYGGSYPDLELELEQALAFLAQQALPIQASSGWLRVTYQGLGLGWVKSVGGRLNNYHPKHWRIRHLPRDME